MQVNILGYKVTIIFINKDSWFDESIGQFDSETLTIRIVTGLNDDMMINALMHEMIHLKQYLFGKELSEEEANHDALFWFSVLRSNPKFLDYNKIVKTYNEVELTGEN